jgi:RNA polymerase sigma-70 factor (ECF subfamily)
MSKNTTQSNVSGNVSQRSEDAVMVKNAQNDHVQFDEIYNKYKGKIFNYFLYRVGRNYDNAEELTQETFLHAFKALDRFVVQDCSYLTFLLRVAHNLLVNHYRGSKLVLVETVPDDRTTSIDDVGTKIELEKIWKNADSELTVAENKTMRLRYQKDLAVKDIAVLMKRSSNAVKLLLCHARRKMQQFKPELY